MIDITSLPLLARGGQADIYALDDGKVLRVPRRPNDYERIRYEYEVYRALAEAGAAVPKVFDLPVIAGVPCIVMERIDGVSMQRAIARQPAGLFSQARELARLHCALADLKIGPALRSAKDKARYCINSSTALSDGEKRSLLSLLAGLPNGEAVCHGDFHPGNIIFSRGREYIIDWSAASSGDFLSDAAHTYLLLRVVPRVPGVGRLTHLVQKLAARLIAREYLKSVGAWRPFDRRTFIAWLVIKAGERTWYGLPSEQAALAVFVRNFKRVGIGRKRTKVQRAASLVNQSLGHPTRRSPR